MKSKLIAIAAVSIDGIIGIDNQMPWSIPEDLKHFRNTTIGNILLIGYNTYKSLPAKAFEDRDYIVLSSKKCFTNKESNIYQIKDFNTVQFLLENENTIIEKLYIAGGEMIYNTLLDYCDEAIITWVNKNIPNGNKRFPIDKLFANFVNINPDPDWQISKTGIEFKFSKYKKIK